MYWRGLLDFGKYGMTERRFENILRAFALPMYGMDEEGWGGPAKAVYRAKNQDRFFQTRKFTDEIKAAFKKAIDPGGWLCVDESVFSWLGRAWKFPGWKCIKRKPHRSVWN
jgi:hypothetical protein